MMMVVMIWDGPHGCQTDTCLLARQCIVRGCMSGGLTHATFNNQDKQWQIPPSLVVRPPYGACQFALLISINRSASTIWTKNIYILTTFIPCTCFCEPCLLPILHQSL